jgi:hypothetical protein
MSRSFRKNAIASLLVALIASLVVVEGAEAQRRRRRPRPTREPAATSTETPDETTDVSTPDASVPDPSTTPAPGASPAPGTTPAPTSQALPVAPAPPAPVAEEEAPPPDLSPLREEYAAVMDEVVEARNRIAVLGRQLFETRVRVRLNDRGGRDRPLESVTIRLDGAPIFTTTDAELPSGTREVFQGYAAPGPHVIGVSVARSDRDVPDARRTQEDTVRFEVRRGTNVDVTIVIDDDSRVDGEDAEAKIALRLQVRVDAEPAEAR